jgi:hypothetical protein
MEKASSAVKVIHFFAGTVTSKSGRFRFTRPTALRPAASPLMTANFMVICLPVATYLNLAQTALCSL